MPRQKKTKVIFHPTFSKNSLAGKLCTTPTWKKFVGGFPLSVRRNLVKKNIWPFIFKLI
jgi:hypothetical protein